MDIKLCFQELFLVTFFLCCYRGLCNIDDDYEDGPSLVRCPWIRNKLKNGRVRYRYKGRVAKFLCDSGYELAGKRSSTCVRGEWSNPIPVCVARGCLRVPSIPNGRITEMYRGALLVYDCNPGYTLDGETSIHCDGRRWSANPPSCIVAIEKPDTSCDFESPDLCGWSHDPNHDFDWKRNQFSTPSGHVGTGPAFDHTFGENKGGFYLYIEASSPRKINDTARLFSPVYPAQISGGCFLFWYHMYGATTGGIRVYLKPESHVFDELKPRWEKFGDQGNQWLRGNIMVPVLHENFQIVIEGIRGESYVGDSAIDDVRLEDTTCESLGNDTENTAYTKKDSCRGRCRELETEPSCGCNDSCFVTSNCCSDYLTICGAGNDTSAQNTDETVPDDYVAKTSSPGITAALVTTLKNTEEQAVTITSKTLPGSTNAASTLSSLHVTSPIPSTVAYSTSSTSNSPASISPSKLPEASSSTITERTTQKEITTSSLTVPIDIQPDSSSTSISSETTTITPIPTQQKTTESVSTTSIPITTTFKTTSTTVSSTSASTSSTAVTTTTPTTAATIPSSSTTKPTEKVTPLLTTQSSETKIESSTSAKASTSAAEVTIALTKSSPSSSIIISTQEYVTTVQSTSSLTSITSSSAEPSSPSPTTMSSTRKTYNLRPRTQRTSPISSTKSATPSPTTKQAIYTTQMRMKDIATTTQKVGSTTSYPTTWHRVPYTFITTAKSPMTSTNMRNIPKTTKLPILISKSTTISNILQSGASKTENNEHSSSVPIIVSIVAIAIIAIIAGLVYYRRKNRGKRQSKLSDDSEMRFLPESEYMEYSDASALEKILK